MRLTFLLDGCERAARAIRSEGKAKYAPMRDDAVNDRRCTMHGRDNRLLRVVEVVLERTCGMLDGINVLDVFVERAVLPFRAHQPHDHLSVPVRGAPS
jgi:hypothetical protein